VQNLINRWKDAIVERFVESSEEETETKVTGEILFREGGTTREQSFSLYDHSPRPGRALVRNLETRELLQVVPDVVKYLPRDPFTFLSRRVMKFRPEDVVRVQVESDEASYAITRNPGDVQWSARDVGREVLVTEVRILLDRLSELYADSVVSLEAGLETEATARVSIGLGGETPSNLTLVVSGSQAWIQGGSVAYVFAENRLDSLFVPVTRPVLPSTEGEDGSQEDTP
jgi:hypothetical protein